MAINLMIAEPNVKRRVRHWLKISFPAFIALLLIIVTATNWKIGGLSAFAPYFAAMIIFFWAIYQPRLIPKFLVLVLGLFQDMVTGMPLGMSALSYLLLLGLVVSQRKLLLKEPFPVIWVAFAVCNFLLILIDCALYALLTKEYMFSPDIVMQWAVSVLVYPLMHQAFVLLHQLLMKHRPV